MAQILRHLFIYQKDRLLISTNKETALIEIDTKAFGD